MCLRHSTRASPRIRLSGGGVRAILCAVYVRLSKEDEEKQQNESESIQNQKSLLLHYASERGWEVYDIYCDEDYSGADRLRPDFNRMLRDARQKKFQIILCKTQSRFTRDMELVEKYIHGLFPVWGIRFIAVADNADTEVKGNKKARQINGLVNEWYLEDLSENVRMVFDMKRRSGKYIGSSPIYGYRKDPQDKNKIVPDPPAAVVVRQIFRWSLEGRGRQVIARTLNEQGVPSPARYKAERDGVPVSSEQALWSKTTVWRILRNEMYTGVMIQGRRRKVSYKSKQLVDMPEEAWYRVEGTHEAIIDPETFRAVQRGLEARARSDGRGDAHVLSGLVRCMDCGSTMTKTTTAQGTSYLRCGRYAESGKEKGCTRHSVRLDRLVELVTERLRYYIREWYVPENLEPEQDTRWAALEQERKTLEAQIGKRSQALKSLYLDKVSGILSQEQFVELNKSFQDEKNRLERRLAQIGQELSAGESPQTELQERAQKLLELETLPRELAVQLIERIEIGERDPDSGEQAIQITWKF
ncbi:MAG: recombinase family protein [Oscillospiraceae bacterium]|nr:recombinase family protein [Oscillospiraceae bacterium]